MDDALEEMDCDEEEMVDNQAEVLNQVEEHDHTSHYITDMVND